MAWVIGGAGCTEPPDDGVEPPPRCSAATYQIDAVDLAATWGDATAYGLDVDRDGDRDNKLGSLNATLTQVYDDWHPEDALAALLAAPTPRWLLKVERCEGSARLAASVGIGHDDGDGVYALDWGEPALGEGNEAWGGVGLLPVARLGDGTGEGGEGGWSPELGLAIALRPDGNGMAATVGFGVEVTDELLAPVAGFLSAALARGDSRFAAGIDLDRDGVVSVAELRMAPAVRTLLASDLDLVGGDGVADRISIGLGIRARPLRAD